jgi:tellurite resistance protein
MARCVNLAASRARLVAGGNEMAVRIPIIPAAFFGMVLGLSGLGGAWRVATRLWALPAWIGETISLLGVAVCTLLIVLYALKWLLARPQAMAELVHPVQCCFIGLVGVATMLAGGGLLPYAGGLAVLLVVVGAVYTLLFGLWRTGGLWQGGRQDVSNTPVLYLPAVAGSFVTAIMLAALGFASWGQLFFGAGLMTWLAIESVLLHRLYNAAELPPPLRPTLGIQLAPAAVGAVAYLAVGTGTPDIVAHALIGYALLQALILLRLLPWICKAPFSPAYWAFTFGATALATACLRLVERGDTGPMTLIAPVVFIVANGLVGLTAIGTLGLMVLGRMPLEWSGASGAETHAS